MDSSSLDYVMRMRDARSHGLVRDIVAGDSAKAIATIDHIPASVHL